MSKGEGGGVSIVFGFHSVVASGRKRAKLTHATQLDTHLTQKPLRDKARELAQKGKKKKKIHLSKAERRAENEARRKFREAPKQVVVEHRAVREVLSIRTVKRSVNSNLQAHETKVAKATVVDCLEKET